MRAETVWRLKNTDFVKIVQSARKLLFYTKTFLIGTNIDLEFAYNINGWVLIDPVSDKDQKSPLHRLRFEY